MAATMRCLIVLPLTHLMIALLVAGSLACTAHASGPRGGSMPESCCPPFGWVLLEGGHAAGATHRAGSRDGRTACDAFATLTRACFTQDQIDVRGAMRVAHIASGCAPLPPPMRR